MSCGANDCLWPRVASETRDLPAGDPLLRSACQLRCLATPVVLRDAWMARHALGVLNQPRRDSVHQVFRNAVKHPGPYPADPNETLQAPHSAALLRALLAARRLHPG